MTLYASHPHVFHCASFIRRDTDSVHFVIDMEPGEMRRRTNSRRLQREKEKQQEQQQNGDVSGRRRARSSTSTSDSELVSRAEAAAAQARGRLYRWRRRCRLGCACCSRRLVLAAAVVMSLLSFCVLFVWYVNSEVERYCYETFPAWLCESTGAEHIKCQLKALFMCKYSVELVEYLNVNATQLTSRCEQLVESVCISMLNTT